MKTCSTPNCGRAVPWDGHNFCRDCVGTVLRTGQPPRLPVPWEPAWRRYTREHNLARADWGKAA